MCGGFSRELLNAHRDNLGTMVKLVIFNELSNARNPNNMQVLHTVLQHSPEQAPKVKNDASDFIVSWKSASIYLFASCLSHIILTPVSVLCACSFWPWSSRTC